MHLSILPCPQPITLLQDAVPPFDGLFSYLSSVALFAEDAPFVVSLANLHYI